MAAKETHLSFSLSLVLLSFPVYAARNTRSPSPPLSFHTAADPLQNQQEESRGPNIVSLFTQLVFPAHLIVY